MADSVIDLAATSVRSYGKNTYRPQAFEHIYTCNTGQLIPTFATIQINPGSTYKITTSILARLNTSRYPTIARGWIEYAWFYVPHMQVWDNWDVLMGENKESAWYSQPSVSVPQINIPSGSTIQVGSLLDHFNWRTGIDNFSASALKVRAYNWIIDQYYRDQNIEAPYAPDTSDSPITYATNGDWTVGGTPYSINRKADLWSTLLPQPQKGPDVLLPLGTSAPVFTGEIHNSSLYGNQWLKWRDVNGTQFVGTTYGITGTTNAVDNKLLDTQASTTSDVPFGTSYLQPSNLYADLNNATAASINTVRDAVVAQHIYERDARSGTRAPEMLWARWGVEVDVLELGRPRLLTMNRFGIDFEQVPQTSATGTGTGSGTEQGTLTAFGYTNNRSEDGTFSFKYAGTLMCLCAIRFEHKYQQGIPYEDLKKDRFDFWHPEFAGLGDDAVPVSTIYATGGTSGTIATGEVFGYAERGWEYKNFQSCITGQARSEYNGGMDYVHLADLYTSKPTLSRAWMKENPDNLDRTIFVTSAIANQWLVDFVAEFEITDTIPLYSIPGIDRL